MRLPVGLVAAVLILGVVSSAAGAAGASQPAAAADPAREAIVQALATGGDIPGQARNLAKLAWPAGKRDEVVAARARLELSRFGNHALGALRESLNSVKVDYTEEVVTTIIEGQRNTRADMAKEYLVTMLDALWVGSHGAKARAIQALVLNPPALAVAPMIDSAIADPSLAPQVIEALGSMRFPQARFYLERVMMQGPPPLRPMAASSLAQIGGAALTPLKAALKSQDREARLLAVRALLPAATEYELGALYEYIEKHGDDDPGLTAALKTSATAIEKAIAARDATKAADSPKDF